MGDIHDFYMPNFESEYPIARGPLMVMTYLTALEESSSYKRKRIQELVGFDLNGRLSNGTSSTTSDIRSTNNSNGTNGVGINDVNGTNGSGSNGHDPVISITEFDYMIYHSPYGMIVQKAHARLVRFIPSSGCCPFFPVLP